VIDKIKSVIAKMNEYGIPLPMLRIDGKPSITATFAFISFNTALFGQIGKVAKVLGDVDLNAANYLFFGCLFAYLGRRMTAEKGKIEVSDKSEKSE
jgi:uncharacterized membrane protein YfcA